MEGKRLYCIRGATFTENTSDAIRTAVGELFDGISKENPFTAGDMVSVQFTMTDDLNALNAASALRSAGTVVDVSTVPLFCAQEPKVNGMLPRVIRIMVSVYMAEGSKIRNVYLNGAQVLRPDFVEKNG